MTAQLNDLATTWQMATNVTFKHQLQSALLNLTVRDLWGQSTNEYNNNIYDVNYSNQNMVLYYVVW